VRRCVLLSSGARQGSYRMASLELPSAFRLSGGGFHATGIS